MISARNQVDFLISKPTVTVYKRGKSGFDASRKTHSRGLDGCILKRLNVKSKT
jgi:hypothetical protein